MRYLSRGISSVLASVDDGCEVASIRSRLGTSLVWNASCCIRNYGLAIEIDPFELGNGHFGTRFGDGWSFGDTRVTRSQVEAIETYDASTTEERPLARIAQAAR